VAHLTRGAGPPARSNDPLDPADTWTRETEGGVVIYDIEFGQERLKFEADIKQDGTMHNWERQASLADLPGAVKKAMPKKREPRYRIHGAMRNWSWPDGNGGEGRGLRGYLYTAAFFDEMTIRIE
jgi:hypothetical protein